MFQMTRIGTAAGLALAVLSGGAAAQGADHAEAVARLELAVRQPALANRIAALQCRAESGQAAEAVPAALAETRAAYAAGHEALVTGAGLDAAAGATAEAWAEVAATWPALEAVLDRMADPATKGPRDFDTMLRDATALGSAGAEIARWVGEAAAATGSASLADVLQINAYARQFDLAQEMMEDYCLLARGDRGIGARFEIEASVAELSAGLAAMQAGAPEAGVVAPASAEIAAEVEAALASWAALRPTLLAAANGAPPTAETVIAVHAGTDALGAVLSNALALHAAHVAAQGS